MQWNVEVVNSLIWIAKAFVLAGIGLLIVGALVIRFTVWGRQFWRLAKPFFSLRRDWRPSAMVALILLMAMAGVRMQVLFSYWYNGFYDSLQALNAPAFWVAVRLFAVLATVHIARILLAFFIGQAFDIRWRVWFNRQLTDDWLNGRAYYRAHFLPNPIDNPDQRIQVDIGTFVNSTRTLTMGAVSSMVSLVTFTGILWSLSGPLPIGGIEIPRGMVFAVYLYVLVVSVFAFWLGRPLIRLNFMNETLSANFRYALIRVREYAENIAFYRGENVERTGLMARFAAVISNVWDIVFRTLKFNGFNLAADQAATVFPMIVQAPRLFSGAIKLGDVMQSAQAFGQVQESLSFFRQAYDNFAEYRAALIRLTGFVDANRDARALPSLPVQPLPDALDIDHLDVNRPNGEALLKQLHLRLAPGQALLIQGASGSGKTTLMRSLAGLWPHTSGSVKRPEGSEALFLPQRPYLPLGTLRTALAYPAEQVDETRLRDALEKVQLSPLIAHLDDTVSDWSQILSIGEQQRLAFARVLLARPRIVFLDEATSATDEGLEHALYALLRRELPDCMLISVGHRSTLNAFHSHRLALQGEGRWDFGPIPA